VAHKPTPASRRTDNLRSPRVLPPSPRPPSASTFPASHSRCSHVERRSRTGCRGVWRLQRRARLVRQGRRPCRGGPRHPRRPRPAGVREVHPAQRRTRRRVRRRRPRHLRRASTRSVAAAKARGHPTVFALYIEGCDARSRGRAGRAFPAHCAALATSLAGIIVLNFWYRDIDRLDATRRHAPLAPLLFKQTRGQVLATINEAKRRTSVVPRISAMDSDVNTVNVVHKMPRTSAWERALSCLNQWDYIKPNAGLI
jgi:hypothetical protein